MYLAPTVSRDQISKQLHNLATEGAQLYERAQKEPMGPRDLAKAIDLNQRYVEVLAELEEAELEIE